MIPGIVLHKRFKAIHDCAIRFYLKSNTLTEVIGGYLSLKVLFWYQYGNMNGLSILTASSPSTDPCRFPYLTRRCPPALVLTLPPMWQEPLLPKSSGIIKPCALAWVSSVSSMHPASQTREPIVRERVMQIQSESTFLRT